MRARTEPGLLGRRQRRRQPRAGQEADRLGYAVVWAAEAYGSDAATVLAWVAAQTERIDVGSAVFQIPGRTPAHDRDDRGHPGHPVRRPVPARAGRLRPAGVRGLARRAVRPSRWPAPGSTSQIVRQALAPRTVSADGEYFTLPLPDGPGKALRADRAPGA